MTSCRKPVETEKTTTGGCCRPHSIFLWLLVLGGEGLRGLETSLLVLKSGLLVQGSLFQSLDNTSSVYQVVQTSLNMGP